MYDNITIRPTKLEDAEQHVKLGIFVWRNAYKHIFPEEVFIERENKAEEKIKNFDTCVQNDDMCLSYVAEIDGKIIGFILGKQHGFHFYVSSYVLFAWRLSDHQYHHFC